MAGITLNAYDLAQRFVGLREVPGTVSNPMVLGMLHLDTNWPQSDEVPWCSAFTNYIAWLLRLPRSKSLTARSWLGVGTPIGLHEAKLGFDVVILSRGTDVLSGHVGFFARHEPPRLWLLGGNQDNSVSVASFNETRVVGVRRLLG